MNIFPRKIVLRTVLVSAALAAPFGLVHAQAAGPQPGRWSASLGGGGTWTGDTHVQNAAGAAPTDESDPTTITLFPKDYHAAYGTGWNADAELGFGLSDSLEAYGRVAYESLPGRTTVAGVVAGSDGYAPVLARLGDLDSWNFSLGERYYFLRGMPIRPFVALGAGVAHLEQVNATYAQPYEAGSLGTDRYFTAKNGFYGDAGFGLAMALNPRTDIKVGVDAEYFDTPAIDGAALESAGIPALSASQPRWLVPVTVGVGWRF